MVGDESKTKDHEELASSFNVIHETALVWANAFLFMKQFYVFVVLDFFFLEMNRK